jgi:integrase
MWKARLKHHEGELVFPLTRNVLVSAWRRIVQRAEIKNFRFHDLRHEGATRLFERGLTTMEVQKITGIRRCRCCCATRT